MAASREYLEFVLEQLSDLDEITCRPMMGEYMIYYRGKLTALVCDDRLLIKPVESVTALLPDAPLELPYDGAKPMIKIEDVDDRQLLSELFRAAYPLLPFPKPKKKKV